MLYRIKRITGLDGRPRPEHAGRVGREGYLLQLAPGYNMAFWYSEPDVGTLVTSRVSKVLREGNVLKVETKHSIYLLAEVEAREDVWPGPVEREVVG